MFFFGRVEKLQSTTLGITVLNMTSYKLTKIIFTGSRPLKYFQTKLIEGIVLSSGSRHAFPSKSTSVSGKHVALILTVEE
jgi:hypothetical protein